MSSEAHRLERQRWEEKFGEILYCVFAPLLFFSMIAIIMLVQATSKFQAGCTSDLQCAPAIVIKSAYLDQQYVINQFIAGHKTKYTAYRPQKLYHYDGFLNETSMSYVGGDSCAYDVDDMIDGTGKYCNNLNLAGDCYKSPAAAEKFIAQNSLHSQITDMCISKSNQPFDLRSAGIPSPTKCFPVDRAIKNYRTAHDMWIAGLVFLGLSAVFFVIFLRKLYLFFWINDYKEIPDEEKSNVELQTEEARNFFDTSPPVDVELSKTPKDKN